MIYRCILPTWAEEDYPNLPKVQEGEFSQEEIQRLNNQGYNIYFLPNHPSIYEQGSIVDGTCIDVFDYVFVDMDLKDGTYKSKEDFLTILRNESFLLPTFVVDSGNGIHAYWRVLDLDANSYLRLQRRLMRLFKTDPAVAKIYQLMRWPGTNNTKLKDKLLPCYVIFDDGREYEAEELAKRLPVLLKEDEEYCVGHYNKTYDIQTTSTINEDIPVKFIKLMRDSTEVRDLWTLDSDDRSGADFHLGHILFAHGFTRDEALSVLVNCQKAKERSPIHRANYAQGIVDKVWSFEDKESLSLSSSVKDILKRGAVVQGTRIPCSDIFDGTEIGFKMTHVLGLVGGSGSGKTTLALNYFWHFTKLNPQYIHLFVSLEQPEEEIALRWAKIVEGDERLYEKVHVLGNYNKDGSYRHLSLDEIAAHVKALEKKYKNKVGCVVIDHLGVLKKPPKNEENQGIIDICSKLKKFAVDTNTFLVIQSQTNRDKAGIGDLELNIDAAYGSAMFEWYCDYVVTTWQPLKRVYKNNPNMTCAAFKYCKIRHKNVLKDKIKEGAVYVLKYDVKTEQLREFTQKEEEAFDFLNKQAISFRNKDQKKKPTVISKIDWTKDGTKDNYSQNA